MAKLDTAIAYNIFAWVIIVVLLEADDNPKDAHPSAPMAHDNATMDSPAKYS
jgi:hypothetical protein